MLNIDPGSRYQKFSAAPGIFHMTGNLFSGIFQTNRCNKPIGTAKKNGFFYIFIFHAFPLSCNPKDFFLFVSWMLLKNKTDRKNRRKWQFLLRTFPRLLLIRIIVNGCIRTYKKALPRMKLPSFLSALQITASSDHIMDDITGTHPRTPAMHIFAILPPVIYQKNGIFWKLHPIFLFLPYEQ